MSKENQMYHVRVGCEDAMFSTLEEAKAFAEKESWLQSLRAEIKSPDGKTLTIKATNVS